MARRVKIEEGRIVDLGLVSRDGQPRPKSLRKSLKSRLIDETFLRACKRNDQDKVVNMLRKGYKPNDNDLPYLADAIERKFNRRPGQHRKPRIDATGQLARYAADVARDYTRWLRSKGLNSRDKVREKGIESALNLLAFEIEEGALKGM
jgi:hypothetical protein